MQNNSQNTGTYEYTDFNVNINNEQRKIIKVTNVVTKKPFLDEIKPQISNFLKIAGQKTTTVGSKTFQVVENIFWWGYDNVKKLFQKTKQYVEPKFIFLTSHQTVNSKQQLQTINQLNKQITILGIQQKIPEDISHNKSIQVVISADKQFYQQAKRLNIQVENKQWTNNNQNKKNILIPSQTFVAIYDDLNKEQKQLMPKKIYGYGNFCAFDLQSKNQIEYEFLQKLRLSKQQIEGILVSTADLKQKKQSHGDFPDDQNNYLVQEIKEITINTKIPAVKSIVEIVHSQSNSESQQLLLN